MDRRKIEDVAKLIAMGAFLCGDGLTPDDYDKFIDEDGEYTVWSPFESWPHRDIADALEDLKEYARKLIASEIDDSMKIDDVTGLAPCPFCGNDYIKIDADVKIMSAQAISVAHCECNVCGCSGPVAFYTDSNSLKKAREDAVRMWNQRPGAQYGKE